jgi:hypothetical protein
MYPRIRWEHVGEHLVSRERTLKTTALRFESSTVQVRDSLQLLACPSCRRGPTLANDHALLSDDPNHFSHRLFGASYLATSPVSLGPVYLYDVYLTYVYTGLRK